MFVHIQHWSKRFLVFTLPSGEKVQTSSQTLSSCWRGGFMLLLSEDVWAETERLTKSNKSIVWSNPNDSVHSKLLRYFPFVSLHTNMLAGFSPSVSFVLLPWCDFTCNYISHCADTSCNHGDAPFNQLHTGCWHAGHSWLGELKTLRSYPGNTPEGRTNDVTCHAEQAAAHSPHDPALWSGVVLICVWDREIDV